ncbi:hypothetical protein [Corynebacterium auriscanis]|uniref:hypothetical protein n=1 Tax=Corynebacterium auriscanis TaxID=99807 RepID=UPI0012EB8953|nr:hypothetical protein [Corynebacterium auriscanis]
MTAIAVSEPGGLRPAAELTRTAELTQAAELPQLPARVGVTVKGRSNENPGLDLG